MQILIAVEVLVLIGVGTVVAYLGIRETELRIARWLLLDARGLAARTKEKQENAAAVAELI